MKMNRRLSAYLTICVFSIGSLFLTCGISYAERAEITNIVFGPLHLTQTEILVWISSGEIDGVSSQNFVTYLELTNLNLNLIYATILTAKILDKQARLDVNVDSSGKKTIGSAVLY
jgi:hypothetical protein